MRHHVHPPQTRSRRHPQRNVIPQRCVGKVLYSSSGWALVRVRLGVRAMLCTACGAELILTKVVPDHTVAVRGAEHHTFICSGCHVTERRVVFIKDGREADGPPMPMQAARRIKRVRQLGRMSTSLLLASSAAS